MQEWIIAMLAISGILIIRDMAKTVFSGRKQKVAIYDQHPQKERIEKYALSLQKLANTFYSMPYRKEHLSNSEIENIFGSVQEKVCNQCQKKESCWEQHYYLTYQKAYELLRLVEEGDTQKLHQAQAEWCLDCINPGRFVERLQETFYKARQNLIWNNRLIENRLAIAEQLNEVAHTIHMVAEDIYDITTAPHEMEAQIKKNLQKRHVLVKQVWMLEKQDEKNRIFVTLRARGGQCIAMSEVASILTEICGCHLVPARDSRSIVNGEFNTILFVEDVNYKVLYGVSRVTKDRETVSGDNYSCTQDEKQFVMCLSDGMGSGLEACKESETVVELLEQFITSGFSRETAAKMLNSALVLQRRDGMYSTVDICAFDLYSGVCEFLKAGAATTFIRRDNWVETITSTSLAAGLVQQMDFETTTKKLYDGDYLIMVTDGVLDALPVEQQEETMKEIIMQVHSTTPKEFGRSVLERVLGYCEYRAIDDMTVLVAGVWKK